MLARKPADPHDVDPTQASALYFERIRRAALVLTGNPWDADDLAQETFLVMSAQRNQFAGRSSLYTYLYGILLNLERRDRRKRGLRQRVWLGLARLTGLETQATHPDESLELAEWRRGLWSQVARLPDGQRQALVLRFSEGLKYEEIAEALGCPVGTVKSRIFNGLAALRALLGDAWQDDSQLSTLPASCKPHAV
jgi:RNA polymerase sigma-70 factor (ECF subfamily)